VVGCTQNSGGEVVGFVLFVTVVLNLGLGELGIGHIQ
jgi:hypothetical protein